MIETLLYKSQNYSSLSDRHNFIEKVEANIMKAIIILILKHIAKKTDTADKV